MLVAAVLISAGGDDDFRQQDSGPLKPDGPTSNDVGKDSKPVGKDSKAGTDGPVDPFTEQGVAMLSSVLRSPRAVQVNTKIRSRASRFTEVRPPR